MNLGIPHLMQSDATILKNIRLCEALDLKKTKAKKKLTHRNGSPAPPLFFN